MLDAGALERARRLLEEASRVHVISHLDLDGVSAAAIVLRWARRRGIPASHAAAGVRGLRAMLRRAASAAGGDPGTVIVVADLSPGGPGSAAAAASAAKWAHGLIWLDHHVWSGEERRALESEGAVLLLDRERVTAEIACELVSCRGDEVSELLAAVARADDSCSDDPHGLADKWRLVLRLVGWEGVRRAARSLAEGELWPDWADEVYRREAEAYYREIREKTSIVIERVRGLRVAVVTPPARASACDLQRLGIEPGPGEADIVVVAYPRGLSIKTWGPVRADCIASRLGGGGHSNVAGAPRPSLTMSASRIARLVAAAAERCLSEASRPRRQR